MERRTGKWQLFDLSKYPGETNDLSKKRPQLMKKLIAATEPIYVIPCLNIPGKNILLMYPAVSGKLL
jgi:hypothetical protein